MTLTITLHHTSRNAFVWALKTGAERRSWWPPRVTFHGTDGGGAIHVRRGESGGGNNEVGSHAPLCEFDRGWGSAHWYRITLRG